MKINPELDRLLRERLQAAVDRFSEGSADDFGRKIGYTNGGYIRETLLGKKPVRSALVERVHSLAGLEHWFDDVFARTGAKVYKFKVASSRPHTSEGKPVIDYARMTMPPLFSWGQIVSEEKLPDLFRVSMPDNALRATPKGTVLLCSTKAEPNFGGGILVRDNEDGQVFLRRFSQGPAGSWIAEADTPGFRSLASKECSIVAAVVGRFDSSV